MATLAQDISALNASARRVHGADISITVARAKAFGNDDNLILVMGANHQAAAFDVVRSVGKGAKVTEEHGAGFMGSPNYTYSSVAF